MGDIYKNTILNKLVLQLLFPETDFTQTNSQGEVQVCSPIPRGYTDKGLPFFEQNPSLSINPDEGVWQDFTTGKGGTIIGLFQEANGIDELGKTKRYLSFLNDQLKAQELYEQQNGKSFAEFFYEENEKLLNTSSIVDIFEKDLHISRKVIKDMQLITNDNCTFQIPVWDYGILVDIRTYRRFPDAGTPKVLSKSGTQAGLIVGKEQWLRDCMNDAPFTVLCAGEKDMLVARSLGLNAITFTGGEKAEPKYESAVFKDKTIFVFYDRDEAGIIGANKIALDLYSKGANVKVVTGHVNDEKLKDIPNGDFWDLVNIYGDNAKKVIFKYLKSATTFSGLEIRKAKERVYKRIPLNEALTKPENIGKTRISTIQATTETIQTSIIPSSLECSYEICEGLKTRKYFDDNGNEQEEKYYEFLHQEVSWDLNEYNFGDIFFFLQNDKDFNVAIDKVVGREYGSPKVRDVVNFRNKLSEVSVTKSVISEYNNISLEQNLDPTIAKSEVPLEAYVVLKNSNKNIGLVAGRNYDVMYKVVPNPIDKQKAVVVIYDYEEIDSLEDFKITKEHVVELKKFKAMQTTGFGIDDQLNWIWEQFLSRVKEFNNWDLWLMQILVFNSPLLMEYDGKTKAATLDTLIIGDTRVGKSIMATELLQTYGVGKIYDVAAATVQSLIGGSFNDNKSIRLGALSKQNNGLAILEEIKDNSEELFNKLRSVRSSHTLKLSRVSGELETYLFVRLMFITNPKVRAGQEIDLRNGFKDGMDVVKSTITSPEDIARFDAIFLADRPENLNRPTPNKKTYNYAKQVDNKLFQLAIRRAWTLSPEDIIIDKEVDLEIYNQAKKLTRDLNGLENVYSGESELKVKKFAISLASLLLSYDDEFEKLIVKKEHVQFIVSWLESLYLNPTFKWQNKMNNDKLRKTPNSDDVRLFEEIYLTAPKESSQRRLIDYLVKLEDPLNKFNIDNNVLTERNDVAYNIAWTKMITNNFIEQSNGMYQPTPKLRIMYNQANGIKQEVLPKVELKQEPEVEMENKDDVEELII